MFKNLIFNANKILELWFEVAMNYIAVHNRIFFFEAVQIAIIIRHPRLAEGI